MDGAPAALVRRAVRLVLILAMLAGGAGSPAAAAPSQVEGAEISMLVRSTLVALNQANITGNYTVLRDLGGARFQNAFSASALADRFRAFRELRIDLSPAVLFDAQLDAEPRLTTDGLLRVIGHFPTAPQEVIFDVTYRFELDRWRIEDLNVGLRQAVAAVAAPGPGEVQGEVAAIAAPIPQVRPAAFR